MLKTLKLGNVGPAPEMEMELGSRLNIITGDNGLGKSFLLDVAWFVNTGTWPRELNARVTNGYKALPRDREKDAVIGLGFDTERPTSSTAQSTEYKYERSFQAWMPTKAEGKHAKILSVYAMADGTIAVYDPARVGNLAQNWFEIGNRTEGLPPAFVFSQQEVLDGAFIKQKEQRDIYLSNGLIMDWAGWQKEHGEAFQILKDVLKALSPSGSHPIQPGELTRISIDDVRDMPTILMPYGIEKSEAVPIVHASAAIKRITSLAYMVVWMWTEHMRVAKLLGSSLATEMLILLDEVECHLHPSWQRRIVPALFAAINALPHKVNVQLIATTHSPLVMASLEPHFDARTDKWFDLDLDDGAKPEVKLTDHAFEKMGTANDWLVSDGFDQLVPGISLEAENILQRASVALRDTDFDLAEALEIDREMSRCISPSDPAWTRWKLLGKQKGWWK